MSATYSYDRTSSIKDFELKRVHELLKHLRPYKMQRAPLEPEVQKLLTEVQEKVDTCLKLLEEIDPMKEQLLRMMREVARKEEQEQAELWAQREREQERARLQHEQEMLQGRSSDFKDVWELLERDSRENPGGGGWYFDFRNPRRRTLWQKVAPIVKKLSDADALDLYMEFAPESKKSKSLGMKEIAKMRQYVPGQTQF